MNILRKNFRIWWQKPLPTEQMHEEREVSFLELFYDLVYVVIFAEMAHHLTHHLSWGGLGEFVFMFVFVFWAWLNGMLYHSLHGTNDISMRVFTFLQMLFMDGMTIFVTDIFSSSSGTTGFAIAWGLFQLLFTVMWFRTGYHDPKHRQASYPFSIVYLVSAATMFFSATLEPEAARNVWLIVIGSNLLLPLFSYFTISDKKQLEEASTHSLDGIERFGLITIVALGEVVVSAINGVNDLPEFTLRNGLIGGLGIGIAIGLWWLYFDFISRRLVQKGMLKNQLFGLLHLPLTMSIVAAGGVLREMIAHNYQEISSTERWIFVGAAGLAVITIGLMINLVVQATPTIQRYVNKASKITVLCGLAIMSLGFLELGYVGLLSTVLGISLIPVSYGIGTWIRVNSRQSKR